MEAYTSTLGLLTHLLICPHNALLSHLKHVSDFFYPTKIDILSKTTV